MIENETFVIQLTVKNSEGVLKTRHLKVSKEQLSTFQSKLNVEENGFTIIECYINTGNIY
tara:strand:- start:721 stop:900 length:180 start_codon:yes stop_codon:yes gene_type:complete